MWGVARGRGVVRGGMWVWLEVGLEVWLELGYTTHAVRVG